jgi:hypothetical protein
MEVGMSWFVAGGFPMVFIAVFGLLALAGAGRYAAVGGPVAPVLAYAAAVGFASLAGVAVDVASTLRNVVPLEVEPEQMARMLLMGVGESLSPAIVGFAVLAVVSLLTAIGLRRHT